MIYDKIKNIGRYAGLSHNLDTAIAFLKETDLSTLEKGRTTIDGDNVYCNHFSYTTAPLSEECEFEEHIEYLDLHVIVSGSETIAVSPAEALTKDKILEDEDAILYKGNPKLLFPGDSSSFLLVYPGEAHLPKLVSGEPCNVDKIVFKIAIR